MRFSNNVRSILCDIRFWIIFFFVIRLVGITNAPLEIGHNWRQSLTNMISRNFLEINSNIFFPKIDMAGNSSGIIGSEFPIFNYLIYLVSTLFGYTHWYGRLINLIISSLGAYFFYKLIEKLTDKKIAFSSTIVLISSIWFAFSRKIMPDTFSVSLTIIGLFYCLRYIETGSFWHLLSFFALVTIGMLSKIPALSLVSAIPIILFARNISFNHKLYVFLLLTSSVIIVFIWYFFWVPYLVNTYHFQLYFPRGIAEGINEIKNYIPQLLEKFYFSALCSYAAFIFFIIGIFTFLKKSGLMFKLGLLVVTFVFFIFIVKTGFVFPTHNYYIIPFVPVMSLIAGYGLSIVPARFLFIPLFLISFEGIANQQHDFFIKNNVKYKLTLENIANNYIAPKDLVIINGGMSPQDIYFSHHKGWSIGNNLIFKNEIDSLKREGAKYLIIDKNLYNKPLNYYTPVFINNDYTIYKLR